MRSFAARLLAPAVLVAALSGASANALRLPTAPRCPIFPADNPWNRPMHRLPVAANSRAIVASIGAERGLHADFGSGLWQGAPIGMPITVVRATQRKVDPAFEYAAESDRGPYPIPRNVAIEGGRRSDGDRHAVIVDRDRCRLYELFALYPTANGGWRAGSGAIWNLRSNRLRPAGWTSADAAGLPILPGLRATTKSPVAGSTTRSASRFAAVAARTSIPPATMRARARIRTCRQWDCGCGCAPTTRLAGSRAKRGSCSRPSSATG